MLLFIKIQSGEMKLEDAKELQNIFNSNLNKISKGKLNQKIKILNRRLNLLDKINLKRSQEYVALSILTFTIHGKIWKRHTKIISLNYQPKHGTKNLIYLMDHILYQIFKIILNIF